MASSSVEFVIPMIDFAPSKPLPLRLSHISQPTPMRSALFRDITKRIAVIPYRRLGTTYLSHFLADGADWLYCA